MQPLSPNIFSRNKNELDRQKGVRCSRKESNATGLDETVFLFNPAQRNELFRTRHILIVSGIDVLSLETLERIDVHECDKGVQLVRRILVFVATAR